MSEPVERCVGLLRSAPTDSEKFAALLMVTKLVKASDCTADDRRNLFAAIGFDYIRRMLTSAAPDGCPPDIFKSIALTILGCFAQEESIGGSEAMASLVPIICSLTDSDNIDSMVSVDDVLQCLQGAAVASAGRSAMCALPVLRLLVQCATGVRPDGAGASRARRLLHTLAVHCPTELWFDNVPLEGDVVAGVERATFYDRLMDTLVEEMQYDGEDDTEAQLAVYAELQAHVLAAPTTCSSATTPAVGAVGGGGETMCAWRGRLCRTLAALLVSRLCVERRLAAVSLAAATLHALGVDRTTLPDDQQRQFFIVTTNLLCIEVRMGVEDKTLSEALELAETLCVGFMLLEKVLMSLVNDDCPLQLEAKQKQQLTVALRGSLNALVGFLKTVSDGDIGEYTTRERAFIHASVKVVLAWLAEESTYSDDVIAIVPYLLQVCTTPVESDADQTIMAHGAPDSILLRLFLPSLCHLTADDRTREVLMSCDVDTTLVQYLQDRWEESGELLSGDSPVDNRKQEVEDSVQAMTTTVSCLLNIAVLEPERVARSPAFATLLYRLLRRRDTPNRHRHLPLHVHLLVLSLMLVHRAADNACVGGGGTVSRLSFDQTSAVRLVQAAVRFVWEAVCVCDDGCSASLAVSSQYRRGGSWSDQLHELWLLTLQLLAQLLEQLNWLAEFLVESGWPAAVIEQLKGVRYGHASQQLLAPLQTCLTALCRHSSVARAALTAEGALAVCRTHRLRDLSRALNE